MAIRVPPGGWPPQPDPCANFTPYQCYCTSFSGPSATASGVTPGYYSCSAYSTSNAQVGSGCYKNESLSATYNPPYVSYEPRLRLERSVGGSVSVINTLVLSSEPRSLKVTTNGSTINVYAYSSASQVGQIGFFGHDAGEATRTSYVGIVKAQVAANQGTALDNFQAE